MKMKRFKEQLVDDKAFEEWAKEMKCEALEMFCRRGFKKELEDYEYKEIYTVLGKKLTSYH